VSTIADRLRIVPEFRPDEYDRIRELLFGRLERRLSRWDPSQVELELSVKDRDTSKQRMTLECWISGVPRMVATSTERDLFTGGRGGAGRPLAPDRQVRDQARDRASVGPERPPHAARGTVGVAGFEPTTPCSQSRCATKLRHTPVRARA
jgi:hypothetical protein